jgi:hypothetical protein
MADDKDYQQSAEFTPTPEDTRSFQSWTPTGPTQVDGMVSPGNIDLTARPIVHHSDGSASSLYSSSFNQDGREILVPQVSPDGHMMTAKEAQDEYNKTGKHLGMFKSPDDADSYAQMLHLKQGAFQTYKNGGKYKPSVETYDDWKEPRDGAPESSRLLGDRAATSTQAQAKADLPQPKTESAFDFSDLGGKKISAGDALQKSEADAAADNELYKTDPDAFKSKHPVDYRIRKAHDFMSNAITGLAMHDQAASTRALAEAPVRKVVNSAMGLAGVPTGEQQGGMLMSTLPGKGGMESEGGVERGPDRRVGGDELPVEGERRLGPRRQVTYSDAQSRAIKNVDAQIARPGLTPEDHVSLTRQRQEILDHPEDFGVVSEARKEPNEPGLEQQINAVRGQIGRGKSPESLEPGARYLYQKYVSPLGGEISKSYKPVAGLDPEEVEAIGGKTIVPPTPHPDVIKDGWITDQGFVENPNGTNHKQNAPDNDTQAAIKNGHVRVATLGTNGENLHFEAHDYSDPNTRKRIADAIQHAPRAQSIGMEFTKPSSYRNQPSMSPEDAMKWLDANGGVSGVTEEVKPGAATDPEEYSQSAKYNGVEYRGIQKPILDDTGKVLHPGVAMFQDPKSGTSVGVRLDEWTPAKLHEHVEAARERMKGTPNVVAKAPKVVDKKPAPKLDSDAAGRKALYE